MEQYWRIYLKNGHVLSFGGQAHYIDIRDNGIVRLMSSRLSSARTFAIVPTDNILWMETVVPDEGEE